MTVTPSLAYVPKIGWPAFLESCLGYVPNDDRKEDAKQVLHLCYCKGVNVCNWHATWRWWHGVRYNPQWLVEQTAGDWKSFRMFCEAEGKKIADERDDKDFPGTLPRTTDRSFP